VRAEVELEKALAVAIDQGLMYERARITFFLASLAYQCQKPNAEMLWSDAAEQIVRGGYAFLLERERAQAYPLVAVYLRSAKQKTRMAAEHLLKALAKVAPLPLHISGLGGFRVSVGRAPMPDRHWQRRKAGELFRFLLLQPRHTANRELLIDCLWPDQSPDSLQSTFHQATSTLRRLLEPDLPDKFPSRYVIVEAERVCLDLPPGSTVDFEHFEQRLTAALANQSAETLEQVLALYTDDLFPTDRYADWAVATRERLAELYLRGLLLLAQLQLAAGYPYKAIAGCRRILERDPWREDAVLVGMQAHLALNDRPAALRLYHTLECLFRQELGLAPRSDLRQLADSLRQG
jgi:DNA-binding SARP family transcriptional activator